MARVGVHAFNSSIAFATGPQGPIPVRKGVDMDGRITADSLVEEVIADYPDTVKIFMDHGLPCILCGEPVWGTIRENADRKKIPLEPLIRDLEACISQ